MNHRPCLLASLAVLLASGSLVQAGAQDATSSVPVASPAAVAEGLTLHLDMFKWILIGQLAPPALSVQMALKLNGSIDIPTETGIFAVWPVAQAIDAKDENSVAVMFDHSMDKPDVEQIPGCFFFEDVEPKATFMVNADPGKKMTVRFSCPMGNAAAPQTFESLRLRVMVLKIAKEQKKETDATMSGDFQEIVPGFGIRITGICRDPKTGLMQMQVEYQNKTPDPKWGGGVATPYLLPLEFVDAKGDAVAMKVTPSNPQGESANTGTFEVRQIAASPMGAPTRMRVRLATAFEQTPIDFVIHGFKPPMIQGRTQPLPEPYEVQAGGMKIGIDRFLSRGTQTLEPTSSGPTAAWTSYCAASIRGHLEIPNEANVVAISLYPDILEAVDDEHRNVAAWGRRIDKDLADAGDFTDVCMRPTTPDVSGKAVKAEFEVRDAGLQTAFVPAVISKLRLRFIQIIAKAQTTHEIVAEATKTYTQLAPGFEAKVDEITPGLNLKDPGMTLVKLSYRRTLDEKLNPHPAFLRHPVVLDQEGRQIPARMALNDVMIGEYKEGNVYIQVSPAPGRELRKIVLQVVTESQAKAVEVTLKDIAILPRVNSGPIN